MYRKDTILTEVERLTLVIAKLLGLKNNNQPQEAQQLYEDTLKDAFAIQAAALVPMSDADFKQLVQQNDYGAGKLNLLAQLLYQEAASPFKHPAEVQSLYKKMLVIFDVLEQEYHTQSFENISLRSKIQHLLQDHA